MADAVNLDKLVDEDEALRITLGGTTYTIGDLPQAVLETADAILQDVRKQSSRATERAERRAEQLKADAKNKADALRAEGKVDEANVILEHAEDEADALIEAAYRQVDQYFYHRRLAVLLGVPEDTFYALGIRKVRKAHDLIYRHLLDLRGETAGKGGASGQ